MSTLERRVDHSEYTGGEGQQQLSTMEGRVEGVVCRFGYFI